ncbi:MAG: hypothetical protein N2484_17990 [Clostridia bacterium]|nr:hypothetical protein [Clostridia bacterium]
MGEVKSILKVASIYMATIIGAGFASGQEIVQFFSTYYEGGFYGIILAGILFSIIGYTVLDRVYRERIRNYDEFLFPSVGWTLGWIIEIIVALFVLSLFCIMIAGSGRILTEKFTLPFHWCVVIMAAIVMLILMTDIKGVVAVSSFITPILIIGIISVGFYIILFKDTYVFNIGLDLEKITHNWFFSSIIYVSYNSILSVVILCSMLPYLKTRKTGVLGGILGGMLLCFIAFILNTAMYMFYPDILKNELPVLGIIGRYNETITNLYTLVLWLAMVVSALTSGYCFVERVGTKITIHPKILVVVTCALAIPMSSLGFSNLIATLYPIFGYAGMFMVFIILIQWIKTSPVLYLVKANHVFKGGRRK